MPEPRALITLITDFGTTEPFVGVMKGVILGIHPRASIVDITHEVPAQDIGAASYHLSNAWTHFPRGTVHLAVVDPGVGSARRALAAAAEGHLFVAPDNGLLTPVFKFPWRAFTITARQYTAPSPSPTFHGRDIFAPAAAHLARGASIENLGEQVDDPVRLPAEAPEVSASMIRARVLHIDRFGNVVLNVGEMDLGRAASRDAGFGVSAEIGGRTIGRFVTHYAAAEGDLCLLMNSDGRLEIALPGGSAAAGLGLRRGADVLLRVR